MAKFPQKIKLKTGVEGKNKFDLSHQHITTTDYFKMSIGTAVDLIPNSDINLVMRSFMRADPLSVPTFGRASVVNRFYFIPYRLVQKSFDAFYNEVPHSFDDQIIVPTKCRTVSMSDVVKYFKSLSNIVTGNSYDFTAADGTKYQMTSYSRQAYSILVALGYKVEFTISSNPSDDYNISVMRLLALAKVFYDYYDTAQYNRSLRLRVEQILNSNQSTSLTLTQSEFASLMSYILYGITYDMDYFTAAFDNPVGSNDYASNISIDDNTLISGSYPSNDVRTVGGTPAIEVDNSQSKSYITQFIDTALHRVTDYIMRNRLAGSRIGKRFLTRFGIKNVYEDTNKSVKLGDFVYEINFGDVMSNADTSGAALGAYAGKGVAGGESDKITYHSNEFGVLLVVSYVIPYIDYYQGIDRLNLRVNRTQFLIPEYDALGVEPIRSSELYMPYKTLTHNGNNVSISGQNFNIFGYLPRYAEYKVKHSIVSGDYLFDSRNVGLDAWHLLRKINPDDFVDVNNVLRLVHNMNFIESIHDAGQYDRAFASNWTDDNGAEHFYQFNYFTINVFAPMKSLFDDYDFDSDGKQIMLALEGKTKNM